MSAHTATVVTLPDGTHQARCICGRSGTINSWWPNADAEATDHMVRFTAPMRDEDVPADAPYTGPEHDDGPWPDSWIPQLWEP